MKSVVLPNPCSMCRRTDVEFKGKDRYCVGCRREYNQEYYRKNSKEILAQQKEYAQENSEILRIKEKTRHPGAKPEDYSTFEWYCLLLEGDPCSYCGKPAELEDHIVARAKRGSPEWDNLTASCTDCNIRKGARTLLHYLLGEKGLEDLAPKKYLSDRRGLETRPA